MKDFYKISSDILSEIVGYNYNLDSGFKTIIVIDKYGKEISVYKNMFETEIIFSNNYKKIVIDDLCGLTFLVFNKEGKSYKAESYIKENINKDKISHIVKQFNEHSPSQGVGYLP